MFVCCTGDLSDGDVVYQDSLPSGVATMAQCLICSVLFSSKEALAAHEREHHSCKFVCRLCNKAFPFESNLARHMRCHSSVRAFKCQICGKAYKHKHKLKEHIRLVHVTSNQSKVTPNIYVQDQPVSEGEAIGQGQPFGQG